jgi:hypothetical protein
MPGEDRRTERTGVGTPVYQPAGKPDGGTCSDPSTCNPSCISAESTPIAGMRTRTGVDLDSGAAAPEEGTRPDAETDGVGAGAALLEEPAAMAMTANRAATRATTRERVRRGCRCGMR